MVYMDVSVSELICECLVAGRAQAWKCSRVPPLTGRHFDPPALIPFEPAQELTWGHMFGRAQELSCAFLSRRERRKILPLVPLQSDQSSSDPARTNERSQRKDKEKEKTLALTAPFLPERRQRSKLHKADICHSDSTQIVD